MAKKCPRGFICTDNTTVWLIVFIIVVGVAAMLWMNRPGFQQSVSPAQPEPKIIVVQQPAPPASVVRPDLFPEPVMRLGPAVPSIASRGYAGPYQQVGILAQEGGSSGSAAPDRTILPLYGRELDSRRGKWNYYTRTDGQNPVQVPVRVKNRICDDDTNGCDEVYSDDTVHVPALGRSFKASVYRKTMFN